MTEKLDLKVGDRVRLTGVFWGDGAYPDVTIGDIVTVEAVEGALYWNDAAGVLADTDGSALRGWEVVKLSSEDYSVVDKLSREDYSVVDKLANIIRTADGNHDMSAANLADAIVDSGFLFELEQVAKAAGWTEAVNHIEPFLAPRIRRAAHADNPYKEG